MNYNLRFALSTLLLLVTISISAQSVFLSERLEKVMNSDPDQLHHISILLNDRFDVRALDEEITRQKLSNHDRAQKVVSVLKAHAKTTQAPLLGLMNAHPGIDHKRTRSYFIANVIYTYANKEGIQFLANHMDVEQIDLNGQLEMVSLDEVCLDAMPPVPDGSEVGLRRINADKLWEMGYTGRGTIALGADTGIEPDHPALDGQFLGLYTEIDKAWFSWQNIFEQPEDCNGHGTHTVGTILGIDRVTNDTIGVAPNASFLGARILCSQAQGNAGTIDNVASFEWALNPDGDINTTDDIPHVINNSWHDPEIADMPCDNMYVDVMKALEAVGVAVVFSAGNEGPEPSTITQPHNVAYDLVNTFTVGALNGAATTPFIADFSSRGPGVCGGDSSILIKPEVSAPGVSVRSAHLGGDYAFLSGTSMAAPHVAGAILLLKEAFPYLTGRDFKFALYYTCRDLGDPGEDNIYGMGIIDVKAAYDYLVAQGNDPVDPSIERDAVLFGFEVSELICVDDVYATVQIENLGTQAFADVALKINVPNLDWSTTQMKTVNLEPGDRAELVLDPLDIPVGLHTIEIEIESLDGASDEYRFNNKLMRTIQIVSLEPVEAEMISDVNGQCSRSNALLEADYSNVLGGEVEYIWYRNEFGGAPIGIGKVFETPVLFTNTTYWAGVNVGFNLGPENNNIGDVMDASSAEGGIVFNALLPLTIKTLDVYAARDGFGSIGLFDADGNQLDGAVFIVSGGGKQTVEADWVIPAGTNYSIQAIGNVPLQLNTNGAVFPYEVNGLMRIVGNTSAEFGNDAYHSFYNIRVEHNEICGRRPVEISVMDSDSTPVAAFNVSETILILDSNDTAVFEDQSERAVAWEWDFGDGGFSLEQNPTYTYQEAGIYSVSLIVTNDEGCQDAKVMEIEVLNAPSGIDDLEELDVKVYPNPSNGLLYIQTESIANEVFYEVNNLSGALIQKGALQKSIDQVNLQGLNQGIYILVLKTEGKTSSHKIVIY